MVLKLAVNRDADTGAWTSSDGTDARVNAAAP